MKANDQAKLKKMWKRLEASESAISLFGLGAFFFFWGSRASKLSEDVQKNE